MAYRPQEVSASTVFCSSTSCQKCVQMSQRPIYKHKDDVFIFCRPQRQSGMFALFRKVFPRLYSCSTDAPAFKRHPPPPPPPPQADTLHTGIEKASEPTAFPSLTPPLVIMLYSRAALDGGSSRESSTGNGGKGGHSGTGASSGATKRKCNPSRSGSGSTGLKAFLGSKVSFKYIRGGRKGASHVQGSACSSPRETTVNAASVNQEAGNSIYLLGAGP